MHFLFYQAWHDVCFIMENMNTHDSMNARNPSGYYTPRFRMAAAVGPMPARADMAAVAHRRLSAQAQVSVPPMSMTESSGPEAAVLSPTGAHRLGSIEYLLLGVLVLGGTIALSWDRIVSSLMEWMP
jgi:hypothetical protein